MEIENAIEYFLQCESPDQKRWSTVIYPNLIKDEDEARDALKSYTTVDGSSYGNYTFRIIKKTSIVCVVDEKVREAQS